MARVGEVHVKIKVDTSGIEKAMAALAQPAFSAPLIRTAARMQAQLDEIRRVTATPMPSIGRLLESIRRMRARQMHPSRSSGPRPLCIDGHAYARRRKARRRR